MHYGELAFSKLKNLLKIVRVPPCQEVASLHFLTAIITHGLHTQNETIKMIKMQIQCFKIPLQYRTFVLLITYPQSFITHNLSIFFPKQDFTLKKQKLKSKIQ